MKRTLIRTAFAMMAILFGSLPALSQTEGETWKPIGDGMLRDDAITRYYFLNNYWEFPVEMQESEQTPGRYRLVNAYKNCPSVGGPQFPDVDNYLIVDASDPVHVYVEPGCVSYYIGEGQALCLWSIAEDYYNNLYGNWDRADEEGVCGTLEDGAITFPRGALLAVPIEDLSFDPSKHDYIWGQVNQNGMFRLKLPGTPDSDIDISLIGMAQDKSGVLYSLNFSGELDYVKVGVFEGNYTGDMRSLIEQDKVPTYKCEKSQTLTVPYDKDGIHTLMAVPYANNRSYKPTYQTKEWNYSEDEWKNVGKAHYTEAIISSNELRDYGFKFNQYDYDVEVEQNVAEPWLIRLVNPYSPDCYPAATSINYDASKRHDLYFDLSHHDCVQLLHNEDIGLNLGFGRMEVRSMSDLYTKDRPFADENMTLEEYMADPAMPKCKYNAETKTIECEPKSIRILFPGARPDAWYFANQNGNAKVELPQSIEIPESASVNSIETDNTSKAEYYTIGGVKTGARNPKSGIYIMRRGNKATKVMVNNR